MGLRLFFFLVISLSLKSQAIRVGPAEDHKDQLPWEHIYAVDAQDLNRSFSELALRSRIEPQVLLEAIGAYQQIYQFEVNADSLPGKFVFAGVRYPILFFMRHSFIVAWEKQADQSYFYRFYNQHADYDKGKFNPDQKEAKPLEIGLREWSYLQMLVNNLSLNSALYHPLAFAYNYETYFLSREELQHWGIEELKMHREDSLLRADSLQVRILEYPLSLPDIRVFWDSNTFQIEEYQVYPQVLYSNPLYEATYDSIGRIKHGRHLGFLRKDSGTYHRYFSDSLRTSLILGKQNRIYYWDADPFGSNLIYSYASSMAAKDLKDLFLKSNPLELKAYLDSGAQAIDTLSLHQNEIRAFYTKGDPWHRIWRTKGKYPIAWFWKCKLPLKPNCLKVEE
ncbi:hypothetical protein [Croceimicrobium sp.]|uniref:hypothetical protein n=1 Tax=Croceimicrobium sp. TaxID=2828340 RepID=UPI003BA8A301